MKLFVSLFALVAVAAAQVSNEYLPPNYGGSSAASNDVGAYSAPAASYESYETAAAEPAHSYSDAEGYRYKTHRRRVFKTARRHRREVSAEYLPPAASAPSTAYLAPAASFSTTSYAEPDVSYGVEASAPVESYETYDTGASIPSASFSGSDGYRYKTNRRRVVKKARRVVKTARRHRREVSAEYLPPAASAPSTAYLAPAASFSTTSYAEPAVSYGVEASAPVESYETYDTGASIPSASFSGSDGYRYKTNRRRVVKKARRVVKTARRHRREVSAEYLPPAASAPSTAYLAPAASFSTTSYAEPAVSYGVDASAPVESYETYDTGASIPSASFSGSDGYRYKTNRRRVVKKARRVVKTARRHRREVSTEYLPPAASAPSTAYLAPAASFSTTSYAEPAVSYGVEASAPVESYETYDTGASIPSASFSGSDGYRYKTNRRRVVKKARRVVKTARRHRREVSTEYLPPAASAPSTAYLAPAASYSVETSVPVASYESYEVAGTAPAHTFSEAEGYRYKTNRRRVFKTARRHRRDVSTEYLPPAASAPAASYSAPGASFSVAASAPAESYSAPAASNESYETAAAEPAHSFSEADGYRYKTVRRRVIRRRRS